MDRQKLCSGIAYCIRRSKKCGNEVATQSLWDALHSLTVDQFANSNSRPALSLYECLHLKEKAPEMMQQSSPGDRPMMVPSIAAGLEAGTQTHEAVISHAEWNVMTKEIVKKTVEMTLAEATAPVQAMVDKLQELQLLHRYSGDRQNTTTSSTQTDASPAADPMNEVQLGTCFRVPGATSLFPTNPCTSSAALPASSSGNTLTDEKARAKEERRNARHVALLARLPS